MPGQRRFKLLLQVGPSIIWAFVILKLLLSQTSELPKFPILLTIPHFDKWVHAILFGVWTVTLLYAGKPYINKSKVWKVALSLVLIMGMATEIIQELAIDSRNGSILDLGADLAGASLVLLIAKYRMKVSL